MWKDTKSLCSYFLCKESRQRNSKPFFHRERPNCGKQAGIFPSPAVRSSWVGRRAGIHPRRGMVPALLLRCEAVGAGYTRPGNGTAAIRWPGRRIRRPYGQPIHRQFPSAGPRCPPYGPPQKNTRPCDRAFVCRFQLNMTTSSLGFSPGSTLRAVSTGPVESGVWPW